MSMTVAALAEKLATMIPVATATANGVMSAKDRIFYPANNYIIPFSRRLTIPAGKKARVWIDSGGSWVYTRMTCWGDWLATRLSGMIEKLGGSYTDQTTRCVGLTASGIYVSNLGTSAGKRFIDMVCRTGREEGVLIELEVVAPMMLGTCTIELFDATDEERVLSNLNEV